MIAPHTIRVMRLVLIATLVFSGRAHAQVSDAIKTLKIDDTAKDFEFQPLEGTKKVKLSALTKDGPVVLVVLRGFPGYQCPACSQQVNDLREHAKKFIELNTKVVLVYPGPAEDLKERAHEFLKNDALPKPLLLVIDPGYQFTNLYGLRWDVEAETAYPSTFVLDPKRVVRYRKVSKTHGDRAKAEEVLEVLAAMQLAETATGREIPGEEPELPRQIRQQLPLPDEN